MQEAESIFSIDQLLSDLAKTLSEERSALIHMDVDAIERTATHKALLNDELTRRHEEFSQIHRKRLRVIQTDARHNLILLVHARDQIQNTLSILTGRPALTGHFQKPPAASVRLDLRG